ncbi:MAG: putative phosphoribosyl transferase [Candidatus Anoxychlamydiales bacterium]|nr:putative phosphoribosyl transferase [Candidatus Anoxychlamydiales bacterium]
MYFKDRIDAANKLKIALEKYKNKDVVVLALLRGGIIIADIIATYLNAKLDIIICKKLSSPDSSELAIGSICSNEVYLNEDLIKNLNINKDYIEKEIERKKNECITKEKLYRNYNQIDITNKTIILVDDGIATGSTIISAINALKNKAKKIVIASPVTSIEASKKIKQLVDDFICLNIPSDFFSISEFYEDFEQIDDCKVTEILKNHFK